MDAAEDLLHATWEGDAPRPSLYEVLALMLLAECVNEVLDHKEDAVSMLLLLLPDAGVREQAFAACFLDDLAPLMKAMPGHS
ncbi:MAG: hypothetical protein WD294_04775 [Phycisphaeraceae bacterium]